MTMDKCVLRAGRQPLLYMSAHMYEHIFLDAHHVNYQFSLAPGALGPQTPSAGLQKGPCFKKGLVSSPSCY